MQDRDRAPAGAGKTAREVAEAGTADVAVADVEARLANATADAVAQRGSSSEAAKGRRVVRVAAAIIMREGDADEAGEEILAAQRGYGEFKDWWEFPGGKVQPGETPREACVRELREELAVELVDLATFMTVDYDYPDFHLTMDCFTCRLAPGARVSLLEHEGMRWLDRTRLDEVAWLPADIQIIDALRVALA